MDWITNQIISDRGSDRRPDHGSDYELDHESDKGPDHGLDLGLDQKPDLGPDRCRIGLRKLMFRMLTLRQSE